MTDATGSPSYEPALQAALATGVAIYGYKVSPLYGVLALAVLAMYWPPRVRWRPLAAGRVLLVYLPFLAGWLLFTWAYLQLMHRCGVTIAPQQQLERLAEHGLLLPGLAGLVFSIVVVAPVVEEILFRGYLFTAFDVHLGRPAAHLLTAGLFGLVHGLHYAVPIGVLALLFGWLRARNNALLPAILAHVVHNGMTVALALCWPEHLDLLYPR